MTSATNCWRRLAMRLARHAEWVLPGARTPWADAMRHELDYISDDPVAVRWALGCVLASYRARLTARPRRGARIVWRPVAASGALMLLIGFALLETAGGQTAPPPPKATCDLRRVSPASGGSSTCTEPTGRCDAESATAVNVEAARESEQPCAGRIAPELQRAPSGQ
jgi:hypothetical protein